MITHVIKNRRVAEICLPVTTIDLESATKRSILKTPDRKPAVFVGVGSCNIGEIIIYIPAPGIGSGAFR